MIDFIDKEVLVQNGVNVITKKVDIEYHGTETANYVLKNDFKKYVNDYLNKKEVSKKIL